MVLSFYRTIWVLFLWFMTTFREWICYFSGCFCTTWDQKLSPVMAKSSPFLLVMMCRCSGCVIDVGLDQPPIMNEAKAFFAGRGVPSFSLAPGPLVIFVSLHCSFFLHTRIIYLNLFHILWVEWHCVDVNGSHWEVCRLSGGVEPNWQCVALRKTLR